MTPPSPTLDLTRDDILDARLTALILVDLLDSNDDPEKIQPTDR